MELMPWYVGIGLSCKDLAVALTSCSFLSVIRRLSGHIRMQQISLDRRSPIGLEGITLFLDVGQVFQHLRQKQAKASTEERQKLLNLAKTVVPTTRVTSNVSQTSVKDMKEAIGSRNHIWYGQTGHVKQGSRAFQSLQRLHSPTNGLPGGQLSLFHHNNWAKSKARHG